MIGIPYTITYTSSTYQTQTHWGFRLSGVNDGWIDDFKIYPLEPYPVTAKHLSQSASPGNYYRTGHSSSASPTIWTGGLLPSTGSGDNYQKMTLVFCVNPQEHADADIFGSDSSAFYVGLGDANGSFWYGGRPWTNQTKYLTIASTGSPNNSLLSIGDWHSVMIVYDSSLAVSPNTESVTVWIDGVEVHNGDFTHTTGADEMFSPMDWGGYCYVGNGDSNPSPRQRGLDCYLSYVWCKEVALDPAVYWSKFFDANNKPKWIGSTGQNITGSTPDTYCPHGNFTNNLGSGPDWTQIGTVADAPSSPSD